MPYRLDLPDLPEDAPGDTFDRLVDLGALDVERVRGWGIAALMPDSVAPDRVAAALGVRDVAVSPASGRDADSVWLLTPRPVRAGRIRIVPAGGDAEPGALRLIDAPAFGTGQHPTTALCLEALDESIAAHVPDRMLDVGTGSGVLALAALMMGVPHAAGIDIDDESLRVAKENAAENGLADRLQLACGGPEAIAGSWPLVAANVLAAPLVEMAPSLARRVAHHGRLVLSGIPMSLEQEVGEAYRRLGMRVLDVRSRAGWVALVLLPSW